MIAKEIRRKRPTNFKALAAYVLAEQDGGRGDPVDWTLGDYVLDQAHAGEKVAWAHATNCHADDLGIAVKEILATQGRNKTARADKSFHLVVSFPEGERPTREQMEDIEATLCEALGLGEHQRVAAVHQNTDNWHMHIAINRVHPETLRSVDPYYGHYRLQEAAQALEIKHGLTRDNHSPTPERALNGKASEMEAHAGRVSFARWVAENAAAPLVAAAAVAKTWDEMHQAAATYGLAIKARGAGLIVVNAADERARLKASAVGHGLSFKVLIDRLGPYEPPSPTLTGQAPAMHYVGTPRGVSPEQASLWEKYQAERAQMTEARNAAMASLRAAHLRYAQDLQKWHRQRYTNAAAQHLSRANRTSTYRQLDADRDADHARRKAREKADRQALKDKHKVVAWSGFLAREASRGNAPAVKALDRFVTTQIERDGAGRD